MKSILYKVLLSSVMSVAWHVASTKSYVLLSMIYIPRFGKVSIKTEKEEKDLITLYAYVLK